MVALQSRSNPNSGPRELFSISQIEKAFGAAYMPEGSEGCIRAWGERYLTGLKEPELTYEEALALPQNTNEEKRERSSYIAKTFGKALEGRADEWFQTGTASFADEPGKRLFPGLHLLPHPTQLDVQPDGSRGYLNQQAVSVKLFSSASPEALSFQGFKDAIFLVRGERFLVDYKTTKPKVDNRKNAELGKPAGWWTWMKTPEQLLGDYQWNLYQWDEYSKYERFAPSRWVYFASQETPQARAVDVQLSSIDPERVRSVCTQLADKANALRGYIRGWRASTDRAAFVADLPKNVTACNAFGRLCPYHVRSPGGTCAGDTDQVIPVGQLLSAPNARPIKAITVPVFEPGAFQFTDTGANTDMSIRDQIQQQLAQNGAIPQSPPGAPPPGYGPPPGAGFVPQGQPPQGAAPFPGPQAPTGYVVAQQPGVAGGPSPYAGAPFQPAPGQPGYTPQPAQPAPPAPHVGPPEYQQASQAPPQAAPAPAPIVQQAPAPQPTVWTRGMPNTQDPNWVYDGNGSWMPAAQFATEHAPVQTSPLPAVAQASAPPAQPTQPAQSLTVNVAAGVTPAQASAVVAQAIAQAQGEIIPSDETDNVNEADLAALGALFLTLVQSAQGMLGGKPEGSADAPKKRGRKPKASA